MNASFSTHAARVQVPASVWVSSLWLRVGLVGALVAAYGAAVALADGVVASALGIFVAGVALAIGGFRSSWRALGHDPKRPAAHPARRTTARVEAA